MAQQTSPFLEGKYGWSYGESGWNDGMDENLLKFSFMFDRNVDSIVSTLPAVVNGTAYFNTTDNRLYFAVNNTYYSSPTPKWAIFTIRSTGQNYIFNGVAASTINTPAQVSTRLNAIELTLSTLGSAATKNISDFASPAQLDVVSSQANTYTDTLRAVLASLSTDSGAFIVGNSIKVVATVAELRSLTAPTTTRTVYYLLEHTSGTGKGNGFLTWKPTATNVDDNGIWFKPTAVTGVGRFNRVNTEAEVTPYMFGGVGNGNTANESIDTSAILAAVATGKNVYIPSGTWIFSPLTTTIVFPSPYVNEGNRTSACVLSTGQTVRGDGVLSQLKWGTSKSPVGTLPQCFFKIQNATDVCIKDLFARDAFALLIVDPLTDGSVKNVVVENCTTVNNLIDIIGGRQLAIDPSSKYSENIRVINCNFKAPGGSHSIVFTNTYNAEAIGNNFKDVTQGMCIDMSQGTRGCVISSNTATNCQYFCKVESSDVSGSNEALFSSYKVSVIGNVVDTISQNGILLNTAADNITVTGNVLSKFVFNGILIGQAYASSAAGSVIISDNILTGIAGTSNGGIYDTMTNGASPHIFSDNSIMNVVHGIWVARNGVSISGGFIKAATNGVVLDTTGGTASLSISGVNIISAGVGINFAGTSAVKNISVVNSQITYSSSAFYCSSPTSITRLTFNNNRLDATAPILDAVVLPAPVACTVVGNISNANTSSLNFLTTSTSTTNCIVTNNISNRPIVLGTPNAGTINTNNIINASYSA
jgi:hypothetical protein